MAGNSEVAAKKRRGPGRPFQKGQSGNPTGRQKKDPEVEEILKAASPAAAKKLVGLAESEDPKIAFPAVKEILDRTLGKPEATNKVQVSGVEGGAIVFKWQD